MRASKEPIDELRTLLNKISNPADQEIILNSLSYINDLEELREQEYIRGNNAGYIRAWEEVVDLLMGLDSHVRVNAANCTYIKKLKDLIRANRSTQENLLKIKELTAELDALKSFLKARNELGLLIDFLPQYFAERSQSLDPEFEKIVNDHFWELLA